MSATGSEIDVEGREASELLRFRNKKKLEKSPQKTRREDKAAQAE